MVHNFRFLNTINIMWTESVRIFEKMHTFTAITLIVSFWLMDLWTMPEEVCTALRYQNVPNYDGPEHEYANLLFVASRMLKQHGIGDSPLEEVPDSILEQLHLDRAEAIVAVENVLACAEEIQNLADTLGGNPAH